MLSPFGRRKITILPILLLRYRYIIILNIILEYLDDNNYKGLRRLKKIALQTMSHDRFDVINNSLKTKRKIGTMTSCFSRSIIYCRRRQYYFKRVLRCVQRCLDSRRSVILLLWSFTCVETKREVYS